MKVAVTSRGPDLDSEVDPRFGRCPLLLIVDTESMGFEVLENPAVAAPGGAGIQAAEAVAREEVKAVITGNCGPNAYEALSAAGIAVIVGASGSVREALERYRRGELQTAGGPSAAPYSGMGPGMRPGMGGGMGGGGRGEEAATLAIVLADHPVVGTWSWSVLATDVDDAALADARAGIYGPRAVKRVPPNALTSHFSRQADRYEL
ncbi:MAG: NifB/NifX family molybdenum-iron cluster-binding protein, partial [Dehalococcoidia bacterium]